MPSNGPAENVLYGLKGIPLFTYGMIGITTLVLAYITFTDVTIENPLDTINPVSEVQKPIPSEESVALEEPTASEESVALEEPTASEQPTASDSSENVPETIPVAESEPVVEAIPTPQETSAPPLEKMNDSQDMPKKGGKKRTIRSKEKKRRTIRK